MTITLLAPDGVAVTAQQFRQSQAALHGGGSGRQLGLRSGFRVGTPSTILSATSTTWTLNPCAIEIDPGASTYQGGYGWSSDSNVTGSVTAADATYARKDIVYIQVNDSSAGDGSGATSAPVLYLAGTASATPVAPTLPARSFLLGTITVPAAGGGSPSVVRNPAVYVAAGAALPVSSQAERDALSLYDGLTVQRMDIAGRPSERYDGTKWSVSDTPWTDLSMALGFTPVTTSGWSGLKYAVRSGWVIVNGAVQRGTAWAAGDTCATLPTGIVPSVKIQGTNNAYVEGGNISLGAGSVAVSFSITWPLF